jgi:hypothetical protein
MWMNATGPRHSGPSRTSSPAPSPRLGRRGRLLPALACQSRPLPFSFRECLFLPFEPPTFRELALKKTLTFPSRRARHGWELARDAFAALDERPEPFTGGGLPWPRWGFEDRAVEGFLVGHGGYRTRRRDGPRDHAGHAPAGQAATDVAPLGPRSLATAGPQRTRTASTHRRSGETLGLAGRPRPAGSRLCRLG